MTIESNLWYPPTIASAFDDEFDDAAATTAKWTRNYTEDTVNAIDTLASFSTGDVRVSSNSLRRSWYVVQPPTAAGPVVRTMSQSPSPGVVVPDGFYWARLKLQYPFGSISADEMSFAMFIGATSGGDLDEDDYMVMYIGEADANAIQPQAIAFQGGSTVLNVAMSDYENFGPHFEYVGILKDVNTYHFFAGTAGGSWVLLGTRTYAGAAILDRFGILFFHAVASTPGNPQFGIDFFRYYSAKQLP